MVKLPSCSEFQFSRTLSRRLGAHCQDGTNEQIDLRSTPVAKTVAFLANP